MTGHRIQLIQLHGLKDKAARHESPGDQLFRSDSRPTQLDQLTPSGPYFFHLYRLDCAILYCIYSILFTHIFSIPYINWVDGCIIFTPFKEN